MDSNASSYPPETGHTVRSLFVTRTAGRVWIIPPVGFPAASKETHPAKVNLIIPKTARLSTHCRSIQLRRP